MKILLVDDDPKIHLIMRVWLRKNGHEVTVAANGREGLELIRTNRFDGVIADVNMPLLNGKQLAREILARAEAPELVILLTSRCDTDLIRREINSPRVHIYSKPFSPKALSEMIEQHLAGKTCAYAAPPGAAVPQTAGPQTGDDHE